MPSDDLILNVRQIAGYSNQGIQPADSLLLQRGGLGGPYLSVSAEQLVSGALSGGGPLMVGNVAAPSDSDGGQIYADNFVSTLGGWWGWNVYFNTAQTNARLGSGSSAIFRCDETIGWQFLWAPAGPALNFAQALAIDPTGYLTVGNQVLLARDPAGPLEAATAQWVEGVVAGLRAETVWSVNGRRGDVRLTWLDVPGAAPLYSPRFEGSPRVPTPSLRSNSTRIANTAFVHAAAAAYVCGLLNDHAFVFTFNGRSGDVVLTAQDIIDAGATLNYAPLDSPAFSGYPTAPTAAPGSQTAQLATTAFVMNAVQESTTGVASFNGRTGIVVMSGADVSAAGGALLASPIFTGTPQAPTAAPGTDTGQIATTAFVINELGGVTSGVTTFNGRSGAVTLTLADVTGVGGAPLASPTFNGVPTAPTAATNTSTQQLATTAFVMNAVAGSVASFNGRTGAVTLTNNDLSAAGGLVNPSPGLTGVPTAPTANAGNSSTQIATTAFVAAAIAAGGGVTSFNTRSGAVTLTNADVLAVLPASAALPLINGTASAGTATGWSRGDHVHPTDTSRYSASNPSGFQTASQVASALAAYLPLSGGTLSGNLVVQGLNSGTFVSSAGIQSDAGTIISQMGGGATTANFVCANAAGGVLGSIYHDGNSLFGNNNVGSGQWYITNVPQFVVNCAPYSPGGGAWNAVSDARIKTVQGDYGQGLDEVLRLHPVIYVYKGNDAPPGGQSIMNTATRWVGFVAQELELIFPDMVSRGRGFIDGRRVDDLRSVNVSNLTYALVNAVKALSARLDALEAKS